MEVKCQEIKCEQRSDEWFMARLGKLTASRFPDLMKTAKQRLQWNQTQLTILRQVAAEIITGEVEEIYTSKAMQWGIDNEVYGRELWAVENLETVRTCGFYQHSEYIGGSPDGIVIRDGEDWGVFEIKCPSSKNHLMYELDNNELMRNYYGQILGESIVTGLRNYSLVSFDPRFPDGRKFVTVTGEFGLEDIAVLESRLFDALDIIKEWI